jgi:flavodoxin
MKAAIIYASVHHENTKKVVEAIAGENVVDLIDATKEKERDLSGYDLIGFRGVLWEISSDSTQFCFCQFAGK